MGSAPADSTNQGSKIFFKKFEDFPGGAVDKNLSASAGGTGLIPGLGRFTCIRATKLVGHNC